MNISARLEEQQNTAFNLDEIQGFLDEGLAKAWSRSSQAGLALSSKDIEDIEAARVASLTKVDAIYERMKQTALIRISNIKFVTENDLQFISIGEDCFPRTVMTRWGLKKPAKLGELSCPFDLAVHPIKSTVRLLSDDFSGYLDPTDLVFSEGRNISFNKPANVTFNHEIGKRFAEGDFAELRSVYTRRLQNFRDVISTSERAIFVLHVISPSLQKMADVVAIFSKLREMRDGKATHFVCINTWPSGTSDTADLPPDSAQDVTVIDVTYPFEGYVWHKSDHASQADAMSIELTVANRLREAAELAFLPTSS